MSIGWGLLAKNKKLSYRKQIVCQLHTWYVEGIYSNFVTVKFGLEVTQGHSNWYHSKAWYGFLLTFYNNYGRIFSHLWDIQHQGMAWPWKLGKGVIEGHWKWRRLIDIIRFSIGWPL